MSIAFTFKENSKSGPTNNHHGKDDGVLQRTISPVQSFLQPDNGRSLYVGGCLRCREGRALQTKLKIGDSDDKYEQEADHVADEIMRMPEIKL